MSDFAPKLNDFTYETRVFSVKDLRYTPNGKAVCDARISFSTKLGEEWQSCWWDLTAWEGAAEILASCQDKDDIIIRGGRVKANAYKKRDGELVVGMKVDTDTIERVGSFQHPARPASQPAPAVDPASIPF